MINKEIKDITFDDLLELQKQLDEAVAKPRENGFVPRERNSEDIKMSIIAEVIEFNEETRRTHKTWKVKTEFNKEKILEEATDILFFYLQLVNYEKLNGELEKYQIETINQTWDETWKTPMFKYKCHSELEVINSLVRKDDFVFANLLDTMMTLICLYDWHLFTKEEIIETYLKKWKKNIGRIKGDWSNEI